jgi:chemotaxis protein CheZ
MTAQTDTRLRAEIFNLFQYIQRLREEIATIVNRYDGNTAFETMSDQLDAIVGSTAEATDTILASTEGIEEAVTALRTNPGPELTSALCDQITKRSMETMEACSFQDITGQRVSKIVRSIRFIEERVEALADLWRRDEIETLSTGLPTADGQAVEGLKLEGPQLPGAAISQDEIDKLFD